MAENKTGGFVIKTLLVVVLIAIAASVAVTLIQFFIFGTPNVAITGGVVGALTAGIYVNRKRKKSEHE